MNACPSKSKLWIGFGLMCLAVVAWVVAIKLVMSSVTSAPAFKPGASPAELDAALAAMGKPSDMVTNMMIAYATCGIIFLGGVVVTVMGLIDYSADVRSSR